MGNVSFHPRTGQYNRNPQGFHLAAAVQCVHAGTRTAAPDRQGTCGHVLACAWAVAVAWHTGTGHFHAGPALRVPVGRSVLPYEEGPVPVVQSLSAKVGALLNP